VAGTPCANVTRRQLLGETSQLACARSAPTTLQNIDKAKLSPLSITGKSAVQPFNIRCSRCSVAPHVRFAAPQNVSCGSIRSVGWRLLSAYSGRATANRCATEVPDYDSNKNLHLQKLQ
jgi:hypothetical protein